MKRSENRKLKLWKKKKVLRGETSACRVLDGGVELVDLLSEPPHFLLHLLPLLLQLPDVLHRLLQRDCVRDLKNKKEKERKVKR